MVKNNRKPLNSNLKCSKNIDEQNSSDLMSKFFENRIASKWLSTKTAAQYLCISENALRIKAHRGQMKCYKFGSRLRFKLEDLDASLSLKEA